MCDILILRAEDHTPKMKLSEFRQRQQNIQQCLNQFSVHKGVEEIESLMQFGRGKSRVCHTPSAEDHGNETFQ
ncbi:MAG: hypothetical protein EZS28_054590 [Streblomastix strix]|uniref:Uncharacterized protein n=1 Tax=Streblomastix strix TaxID=222440 RepID=A0A5J4QKM1_9EUKA|nr:MAG: hypothetical protein EZS28_054590 [Streblomastix strix]